MCQIVVVRPGSTLFDDQERIKGCLDMPLSEAGIEQVHKVADEMAKLSLSMIYAAPCESAQSTAKGISDQTKTKWKVCDCFRNLDHGLWQGKLIDEVKRQQPRLFKTIHELFAHRVVKRLQKRKLALKRCLPNSVRSMQMKPLRS